MQSRLTVLEQPTTSSTQHIHGAVFPYLMPLLLQTLSLQLQLQIRLDSALLLTGSLVRTGLTVEFGLPMVLMIHQALLVAMLSATFHQLLLQAPYWPMDKPSISLITVLITTSMYQMPKTSFTTPPTTESGTLESTRAKLQTCPLVLTVSCG